MLTGELRNDGRRVLIQVVHPACDGVGGDRDPGHDDPAVVGVEAGRQGRQARVVDDGETAELLDLLPAVQPLPQASRDLRQSLPTKHKQKQKQAQLKDDKFDNSNIFLLMSDEPELWRCVLYND